MKAIATENKINNKTCEILFSDYFKLRYGFSFATAGALARDALRLTTTLNSYSLKEGQVLRYVVSNTEPAGKALKDCQFVLAKLTVYAPEDAEYRRKYGLKEEKLGQPGKAGLYTSLFQFILYHRSRNTSYSILLKTPCTICSSIILHDSYIIISHNGFYSSYSN